MNILIIKIPKEPRFTKPQIKTFTDICVGIGMIGFGSVAIPAFIDKGGELSTFTFGLTVSCVFWYIAIKLARNV